MTSFAGPAWIQPTYAPVYIPNLPDLGLTEDEQALISRLNLLNYRQRYNMLLAEAYYKGEQRLTSLGIALPPELEGLRVVVGWPKMAVDPYVERLSVDSFRKSDDLEADQLLADLWLYNNMALEEKLAFTDGLALGRSWVLLDADNDNDGDENPGGFPDICVESPLNISAFWSAKTRLPSAVLQQYFQDNVRRASLYLPEQTIHLAEDYDSQAWQIVDRDQHNFGWIPAVRIANRPRASFREGVSEISNELMSITDAAVRTMLNLTAASEFYSVPQKIILGATEEDFMSADGTRKTAWETYLGRVLALQRDSEGALPEIKTFEAYDPSVFTKVIEMHAAQAAGIIGATPQELGLYTDGNPVSAEALQVAEHRRDRRTRRIHANFGGGMVQVAQMALRMMNGGTLPSGYEKLACDWVDPQAVNFTGYSDGLSKLMQQGAIAPDSEVALRKLGFSAVERRQIKAENAASTVRQELAELGQSVLSKDVRMTNATLKAGQPDPTTTPSSAPSPGTGAASGAPSASKAN